MKLLIVDDSLMMRKLVERSLEEKHFTVLSAADGEAGLRMFAENLPDIVTLDITMPKMDGVTCLGEMLKIKPDAKILMVSSQADTATAGEVLQKGAAGIVTKPFTAGQLIEKVNAILGV
jgi:two-component system chemotaxis response regulator CheY